MNNNPSTSFRTRGFAPIAIILIIAGVLVLAGGTYFWQKSKVSAPATTPALSPTPTSTASAPTNQTANRKTETNFQKKRKHS